MNAAGVNSNTYFDELQEQFGPLGFGMPNMNAPAASTGPNGFSLTSAVIGPNNLEIIGWTAPTLGRLHLVVVQVTLQVTSAMTGGVTGVQVLSAGGVYDTGPALYNAKGGLGFYHFPDNAANPVCVFDGDRVQIVQTSSLSPGAAKLYASIWVA